MSRDFVFLSTISWDDSDGAHRPVQFARDLMRRGHHVLFVQVQPGPTRPTDSLLTICSLPELGLTERGARYAWFGREPEGLGRASEQLAKQLDAFANPEAEQRIVIWCAPYIPFVQWLPLFQARGFLKVYDCLDDFEGLIQLGYFFASPEAEEFLVRRCDLMLAVSPPLVDKLRAWAPDAEVHLLRNGFEAELFSSSAMPAEVPADLARGECTLGFWGTIAEWTLDVNAIEYVARGRPNWAMNLIGPVDPEPGHPPVAPRLRALPNVRLLGRVPHRRLAQYLGGFDVCLIPFTRNAFNAAREPLKIYEYLAGFKPVVALNTPQLEAMPAVYLAATREEFLAQIERARAAPMDRRAVGDYLIRCTWQARTDVLLGLVEGKKPLPFDSRLELPSFHPEPDLPRNWRVYLADLDQMLDERTAYVAQIEREAQATQAYIKKLERTHPLVWLRRAIRLR